MPLILKQILCSNAQIVVFCLSILKHSQIFSEDVVSDFPWLKVILSVDN